MTHLAAQTEARSATSVPSPGSAVSGAAAILALAILVRLPYLAVNGPDDGFFSAVASLWRHGFVPYVAAFDVKPPGIYAVLALSQMLFGPELIALRVIGTVSDAVTMWLMLHLAGISRAPGVGVFAVLLFAWFGHALIADDCYSLLIALTTLAMTLAMSDLAPMRKALLSGLAIGAAGLIKQTAAFEGLALLLILLTAPSSADRRWRTAAHYSLGAAALPLACAAYFALHGGFYALLRDTIGIALQRPGANSDGISFFGGLVHFAVIARGIAPVLMIAAATAVFARNSPHFQRQIRTLGLWLACALAGVITQHALLATYLGPLLPPMLLLTGFGLAIRLKPTPRAAKRGLSGLAAGVVAASLVSAYLTPKDDFTAIDSVGAAVQAARPLPADRLYVIGVSPKGVWVYVRAGLPPATPFLMPSQQACGFPNVGPDRIDEAFATRPRFVVTDAVQKRYACERDGVTDKIQTALAGHYRLLQRIGGGEERYNLYEIKRQDSD